MHCKAKDLCVQCATGSLGEKKSVCKGVLVLFPIKILGIKSKGRKRARE